MPIEFPCPHCGTMLKVADGREGAKGKCKACGEMVTVPDAPLPELEPQQPDEEPISAKAAPAVAPPADQTMPRSGYAPSAPRPPVIVPDRVSITRVLSDLGSALGGHLFMLLLACWLMDLLLVLFVFVPSLLGGMAAAGVVVVISFLVTPPLVVGYCSMCLSALRHEDLELVDIFSGFSPVGPSYGVGLAFAVLFVVLLLLVSLPFYLFGQGGGTWPVQIAAVALAPFFWLGFPAVADGAETMEALRFSFLGGYRNWRALMLVSVIVYGVAFGVRTLSNLAVGSGHAVIALVAAFLITPGVFVSMCSAYDQVYAREMAEEDPAATDEA